MISTNLTDTILGLLYRSPVYMAALGKTPPRAIRAVGWDEKRFSNAACFADGMMPSDLLPKEEVRGDFRWMGVGHAASDAWPVVESWLHRHGRWDAKNWRADVLGERTSHWLTALGGSAPAAGSPGFRAWSAAALIGARHLNRAPIPTNPPWRRFLVHRGRIAAALTMSEMKKTLAAGLRALGHDVDTQILSDGGHIERGPQVALTVLSILIDIRDALVAHHVEPPSGLISAIDRMVPFLKGMVFGDGGFTLVNGATANSGALLTAVLQASGNNGRAMTIAPHTGFHRLRAGKTTIILDCGETFVPGIGHRAPCAFEFAVGKDRIIGNCGARLIDDRSRVEWTRALSSTAAHTTVVISNTDAGPVSKASVDWRERDGARLIEACHDGYLGRFGIMHRRLIYVDTGGEDIRGEDTLSGGSSQPLSIRFHVHPNVRVSLVEGGGEAILKPPRGRGWRFMTRHPVMLEDSVSFHDGRQHRTQQIVILGNHEPSETVIKWRFGMQS